VTAVSCGFRQSFAAQSACGAMSSDFATMLNNDEFSDVSFILEVKCQATIPTQPHVNYYSVGNNDFGLAW